MSNFSAHKQRVSRPAVFKPFQQEMERVPRQFCDYMNEENSRFSEICKLYLDGLSMDDVRFLKPEDLISLVPHDHYKHKLLMTIMVRRYLYRPDDCETVYCKPGRSDVYEKDNESCDNRSNDNRSNDSRSVDTRSTDCAPAKCIRQPKTEYSCDKCDHVCTNADCDHSCEDYVKIVRQIKQNN